MMRYRNAPAHIRAAINEQAHRWTTTTGEPLTNVLPRYENEGKAMEEQCDRSWQDSPCDGEIIQRTTTGGFTSYTCEAHLEELENALAAIGNRYPEIYHAEWCNCSGCEGDY